MYGKLRQFRRHLLHPRWWLPTLAVCLIVLFNTALAYNLWRERSIILADAFHTTQSLSRTLEVHASDAFASTDKVLSGISEVLAVRSDSGIKNNPEIVALLQRRLHYMPENRALIILDAQGMLLTDSDASTNALDLSDRLYFTTHRDNARAGLFIGHPTRGRLSGQWLIPVSRRLNHADGSFAGVIMAAVNPETLRAFYESVNMGKDGSVALFHQDGTVMVRQPEYERFIGTSAAETPLFTGGLLHAPFGTAEIDSPLDNKARIISFRALTRYPLIVAVTLSSDAVLAPWWQNVLYYLAIGVVGSLVVALLTGLALKQLDRRQRAVVSLQAAKEASDLASRAKTQFLANMSHELRTPLNAVIGFAEILDTEIFGQLQAKQREYVRDIRGSGLHLLDLINTILDIAKIESGKYELHMEQVDLSAAAAQCLRQMRHRAAETYITLNAGLAPDLPPILADERAIKQIISNLLSNAVKFTPNGGTVTLTITLDESAGGVVLTIADTGIGIAEEDLALVVEPFHQVDNSHTRRYEGTGLGLPLVKSLAEMHGGRLSISSAVGKGTTVIVHLPDCCLQTGDSISVI